MLFEEYTKQIVLLSIVKGEQFLRLKQLHLNSLSQLTTERKLLVDALSGSNPGFLGILTLLLLVVLCERCSCYEHRPVYRARGTALA